MSIDHSRMLRSGLIVHGRGDTGVTPRWQRADWVWMWLTVLVALAARLLHIGQQPLWLDEVFTWRRIHMDVASLIADSLANRHVPSYFLLLRWLLPDGATDAALRMPSALFGAMAVGVVFATAWQVGGRRAACFAGWLMALAPLQVQYGQEARSYALMVFLIAVALWGLVTLALCAERGDEGRTMHRGWIAYGSGTTGALLVLGQAVPWLLASNVALFLVWRHLRRHASADPTRRFLRQWLLVQSLILACAVPVYLAIAAADRGHVMANFHWVPALSWHQWWIVSASAYLMRGAAIVQSALLPTAFGVVGALVLLMWGVGAWHLRQRLMGHVLLLMFAALPLLLLAISPFQSLLVPRYVLWSMLPFFAIAGVGAATLPRWPYRLMLTGLLLLGPFNLLPVYRQEVKPRWDLAAATLSANVRPGDTVYTRDPNAPLMLETLQPKGARLGQRVVIAGRMDAVVARWRQGGRVWAIKGRAGLGRDESLATFERHLVALGQPDLSIREGEEITILMFPAPAALSPPTSKAETDGR